MKNALIVSRSTAQFSYIESVCDGFVKRGFHITLAFDESWSKNSPTQSDSLNAWLRDNQDTSFLWYPKRPKNFLSKILFLCRELRTFSNYCRRNKDYEFYRNRWLSYLKLKPNLTKLFRTTLVQNLLGSEIFDLCLRFVEKMFPTHTEIDDWLLKINPDVVLVTPMNLRFSGETDIVKSLLRLGIPYGVLTLTWDNLSTKGIFQFQPEKLLVWNREQIEDAENLHNIPEIKIAICGAPFFDKWNKYTSPNKSLKFTTRNSKPRPPLEIVYLGSSANIIKDETHLIEAIRKQLDQSEISELRQSMLCVRYHPANWQQGQNVRREGIKVPSRGGTLPSTRDEITEFADLLTNAQCVIGVNTSAMIDAVLLSKVVFSPLVPKLKLKQENSLHYKRMVSTGAIIVCEDIVDMVKQIERLPLDIKPKNLESEKFSRYFVFPSNLDESAGGKVAEELISHCQVRESQPQ